MYEESIGTKFNDQRSFKVKSTTSRLIAKT